MGFIASQTFGQLKRYNGHRINYQQSSDVHLPSCSPLDLRVERLLGWHLLSLEGPHELVRKQAAASRHAEQRRLYWTSGGVITKDLDKLRKEENDLRQEKTRATIKIGGLNLKGLTTP